MTAERYTGRDFQMDFFGKKIHWPTIMKAKGLNKDEYIPYIKALKFVRDNYPMEAYPYTKMSADIYDEVAELLGFELDPVDEADLAKQKERLKFYDSTQTHLDEFHSVDGFFTYIDDTGKERICTLDTTINPEKGEEDVKANVWIGDAPDHNLDKVGYAKWQKERARVIADYLTGKRVAY